MFYIGKSTIPNVTAEHSLILIGTVHGDPQGYVRAEKLLAHLKPDLVTVEISPFSWRYRLKHRLDWQRRLAQALSQLPPGASRHLAILRLAAQVDLPFEAKIAQDYHQATGAHWRPLDLGGVARRHLPRYGPELLNPANLKLLTTTADGSLEEFIAAEFHRAHLALIGSSRRLLTSGGSENLRRERFLARRLRALASRYCRIVHLSGWEHLVGWRNGPGLWSDLADLQPRRLLLDEADKLGQKS